MCEVNSDGVRYILRRNPIRAAEVAALRGSKLAALKALADRQNQYMAQHPKADQYTAWKLVSGNESRLGLGALPRVIAEN